MKSETTRRRVLSLQPETRGDGVVQVVALCAKDDEFTAFERYELEVDYDALWSFAQNLLSMLHRTSDTRMRNAAAGDCATCGNVRLVDRETNGRMMSVNCPDCREAYDHAKPAYPSYTDAG